MGVRAELLCAYCNRISRRFVWHNRANGLITRARTRAISMKRSLCVRAHVDELDAAAAREEAPLNDTWHFIAAQPELWLSQHDFLFFIRARTHTIPLACCALCTLASERMRIIFLSLSLILLQHSSFYSESREKNARGLWRDRLWGACTAFFR